VAAQIDSIRGTDAPLIFPVVPDGQLDHIRYSFASATEGASKPAK